jgi:hypothetical protein
MPGKLGAAVDNWEGGGAAFCVGGGAPLNGGKVESDIRRRNEEEKGVWRTRGRTSNEVIANVGKCFKRFCCVKTSGAMKQLSFSVERVTDTVAI